MTVSDLSRKHCQPVAGGTLPVSGPRLRALLAELHDGWASNDAGGIISRTFRFKNYYQTMAFVNALAWIAHAEDHHPDIEVGYNRCIVHFSTHTIGGLSENDFICAAKIDALLPASE
jgi:4a-hydroxytetrahydrobiopterin dehydratase